MVSGKPLGGFDHVADAGGSGDVGDLVGVGDDGGDAVRHDGAGKLRGGRHRGFDVDVRVDEAGDEIVAVQVERRFAGVACPYSGDGLPGNGDVDIQHFAGEDVDHAGIGEQQVGGFVAPRDGEDV